MAHWECSTLSDRLQSLIKDKEDYLSKLQDKPKAYKKVQDEIVLLKDILTYVQAETNLFAMVVIELVGKALLQALDRNLNGLLMYLPVNNKYKDKVKVGVFNPSLREPLCYTGTEEDERPNQILIHNIRYEAHNIDGIGDLEPEITYLTNNL